jgi:drug/metabolite transporter (DMT)-like permease
MKNSKTGATLLAVLAALLYAINMPASKLLLRDVPPTVMAGLLYLGAGIGIGLLYLFLGRGTQNQKLARADLPFVIGMILLDIAAPILLMLGLRLTNSANASLLNNFEIVATALIALFIFKEAISGTLWLAILLVTLASAILSFEGAAGLHFSGGSLLVLAAASCWGLENNFTRKISSKNTFQIVILKGIFSGLGSLLVARLQGQAMPAINLIAIVMLLGFVAYGLSIFFYIKAQNVIGAAKTSAWYAIAPFAGAFLSFLFLREALTSQYLIALLVMLLGSALVVADTMAKSHAHTHSHVLRHYHEGLEHSHSVTHTHEHRHILATERHAHQHPPEITSDPQHDHA